MTSRAGTCSPGSGPERQLSHVLWMGENTRLVTTTLNYIAFWQMELCLFICSFAFIKVFLEPLFHVNCLAFCKHFHIIENNAFLNIFLQKNVSFVIKTDIYLNVFPLTDYSLFSWWVFSIFSILFPSFSLPDVLCDPTDLIWREGTPFEAITGLTAPSSDGLLAEVYWGFPQL